MATRTVLLLCLFSASTVASTLAGGCPTKRSWQEIREDAEILFTGRLVGQSEHRSLPGLPWLRFPEWIGIGEYQWTYEFETEGYWNGNVPRRLSLIIATGNLFPVFDEQRRMVIEAQVIRGAVFTVHCGFSYPIWTTAQADSVIENNPFKDYHEFIEYEFIVTEDSLRFHFGELSKAAIYGSTAYHPMPAWLLLVGLSGIIITSIWLCKRANALRSKNQL